MKKIKITLSILMLCTASYAGYTAYNKVTMTNAERMIMANLEALTNSDESSSGVYTCYSTYSDCWFINCSTIYRCGNPCTTASADKYSDLGICSN